MVALSRGGVWLLLAALAAAPLLADARASYRDGLAALERGAWAEAAAHFRAAIEQRPEESAGPFRLYLPHFQLGRALFEAGDCEEALAAWQESQRQGAILTVREFQTLRSQRQACRQRLVEERRTAAQEVPRRADEATAATGDDSRQRLLDEAAELLAALEPLRPLPEELDRLAAAVEAGMDAVAAAGTPAAPAASTFVDDLGRLRAAAAEPPAELMAAAESFLAAEHEAVIAMLTSALLASDRERAHARLLLAASRFALWAAGGGSDTELLRLAGEDVRACRQLDPDLTPVPALFSRRFAAFFAAGGRS